MREQRGTEREDDKQEIREETEREDDISRSCGKSSGAQHVNKVKVVAPAEEVAQSFTRILSHPPVSTPRDCFCEQTFENCCQMPNPSQCIP
jgi:hypothetical protein